MDHTQDESGGGGGADAGAAGPTRAVPIQPGKRTPGRASFALASDYERDAVLSRLKEAFAEGRLDDDEFDRRIRVALTARTNGDLEPLLADVPGASRPAAPNARPGQFAVALKGPVRRAGRWRVPGRHTTIVYKGRGELDLRAAELAGPVTTLVAVGYKSTITIFIPPGVRVEVSGPGASADLADSPIPPDAPVVNVRGFAYKGSVQVLARPRQG